jgi:glycosyltransferase involved in cell wall biosynthesis
MRVPSIALAVHALYAALPAIGSRIGGIPEHMIDGKIGFLTAPGDVAEGPRQAQRFDAEAAVAAYELFMLGRIGNISAIAG